MAHTDQEAESPLDLTSQLPADDGIVINHGKVGKSRRRG